MAPISFKGISMKSSMRSIITITISLLMPGLAAADLNVFACEPEWAALAEEIGAGVIKTSSATHAHQDPHYIQARPSLISKVRKADIVICSGAQLEIGWLPMLLKKGSNPAVMPGNPGHFIASDFVRRLNVPANVDRAQGDVHPQGNPHIQTNPHNILLIAQALATRMAELDHDNAGVYQDGLEDFSQRWRKATAEWETRAASLRGKRVITHHKSWVYLEDWLGLEEVANLEPVVGVPPTAGHLSSLLKRFGDDGADIIIHAPYQSEKASRWLSERTGIPEIMLPLTVGGSDAAKDLFSLFDDILDRLLGALET
jgi:zinc/manganese transport system substrate-binding protein